MAQEIESIIAQIQGVVSGRLTCQNDEVVEIHVLADNTRTPKQIVRDIESAILVKLGIEMDHKKISVAQLNKSEPVPAEVRTRFQFKSFNYKTENGNAEVMVTINYNDKSYTAKINGPNTRQNRLRLAASATLSAIEQSMDVEGMLIVGDVQKIVLYGQAAIAAVVCLRSSYQEEVLLGTALNRGDDLESTVRASLDAVNRRIAILKNN